MRQDEIVFITANEYTKLLIKRANFNKMPAIATTLIIIPYCNCPYVFKTAIYTEYI